MIFSFRKIFKGAIPYSREFSQGVNFSAKTKTMGVVTSCKKVSRALKLRSINGTKIKTMKISSEGLRGDSANICTCKNIPLYERYMSTVKIWGEGEILSIYGDLDHTYMYIYMYIYATQLHIPEYMWNCE